MFHQKASSCLQTGGLDHTLMPDEKVTHIARVNYSDTGHIHHSQPLAQVINIDGAVVSSVEAILVSGQYNKWPSLAQLELHLNIMPSRQEAVLASCVILASQFLVFYNHSQSTTMHRQPHDGLGTDLLPPQCGPSSLRGRPRE